MSTVKKTLDICRRMKDLSQDTPTMFADIQEVEELLRSMDKPKVMVYGIYSAGKSSLINALLEENVASVSARPETSKVTAYDAGDYILLDSPGIDSQNTHHDMETQRHISKCHVILFVISETFEGYENYKRMVELIQQGKPFIIVINDKRGEDLERSETIASIRLKIIDNLARISGDNAISLKYEFVTVNVKRALRGIEKKKAGQNTTMIAKSQLPLLKEQMERFLKNEINRYASPLSNLIQLIDQKIVSLESMLVPPEAAEEHQKKVQGLHKLARDYSDRIPRLVDRIVNRYEDTLIKTSFVGDSDAWRTNISNMYRELGHVLENQLQHLSIQMRDQYQINTDVLSHVDIPEELTMPIAGGEIRRESDAPKMEGTFASDKTGKAFGENLGGFASMANGAFKIPHPEVDPTILIDVVKTLVDLVKDARRRQEQQEEEFRRERAAAEERNRITEERASMEMERRQKIRVAVQTQLNRIRKEFSLNYATVFTKLFTQVEQDLLGTYASEQENQDKIREQISEFTKLRMEVEAIKSQIQVSAGE